jgi:hypothetical protein
MAGGKQFIDATAIVTKLKLVCTVKHWNKYPHEGKDVKKVAIHPELIAKMVMLVKALYDLSAAFSFTRSAMKDAIEQLNSHAKFVEGEHAKDYCETMLNRTMGLCHVLNLNINKKPITQWLAKILPANTPTDAEDKKQTWVDYKWDPVLMMGYRIAAKGKAKDYCMPIESHIFASASESDALVCRWEDGSSFEIESLTIGEYRSLTTSRGQKERDMLYEASHKGSNNRITIMQRVDKPLVGQPGSSKLLVSCYEQNRQILQVRLCDFGDVPGDGQCLDSKHPTVMAAVAFMEPIVQQYVDDKIDVAAMKTMKIEFMKAYKHSYAPARPVTKASGKAKAEPKKTGTLKRPGAAARGSVAKKPSIDIDDAKAKAPKADDVEVQEQVCKRPLPSTQLATIHAACAMLADLRDAELAAR